MKHENSTQGKKKKHKEAATKTSSEEGDIAEPKAPAEAQSTTKHANDNDSDFLLDWGGIKKKSGRNRRMGIGCFLVGVDCIDPYRRI